MGSAPGGLGRSAHFAPAGLDERAELAALGDFHRFNRELRDGPVELRAKRRRARVLAWSQKRRKQRAWFTRTGADVIEQRRRASLANRHEVARRIIDLISGPDGAFLGGGAVLMT
jgi:hypothetical protein